MNEDLKNENSIRDYLLGRVADESTLAEFEELLFEDEEFCTLAEITEDALINDFVFGRLEGRDRADFAASLGHSRTRSEKVKFAKALRDKANEGTDEEPEPAEAFIAAVKAFFRKPLNSAAFALVLIGVVAIFYFLPGPPVKDDLAQLKEVYAKERPTESRLDAFGYAPVVTTRGTTEQLEKTRLRRIELELLESAEKKPTAAAHHAVGVFYLTQRKFSEAFASLERAAELNNKDARYRNDLGAAFFEMAKSANENDRLRLLGMANENFAKAVALDGDFLPARFNLALCRQELGLENEAREAWKNYLERDGGSGWAAEARRNLARLDEKKASVKSNSEILEHFLVAFRARDEETAWKINSQTRDVIAGKWLGGQLARKVIDARIRGDDAVANESIDAMKLIGRLDESRNADFFMSEIAAFYAADRDWKALESAHQLMTDGLAGIDSKKPKLSVENLENSRRVFEKLGNRPEALLAALWKAHALTDDQKIAESDALMAETAAASEKYRWLKLQIAEWQSNNLLFSDEISRSNEILDETAREAFEIGDVILRRKILVFLASNHVESGEFQKGLRYLGQAIGPMGEFAETPRLRWLSNLYSAKALLGTGQLDSAEMFARESLAIALGEESRESQMPSDSYRLLLEIARVSGSSERVSRYAEEGLRAAEATADEAFREKLRNYFLLEIADLKYGNGDFAGALTDYQNILTYWDSQPENQIDRYAVHKGKLLCLQKLGRRDEVNSELAILFGLTEKYRRTLYEEDTRNAFFDHEQVVFDVTVENFLADGEVEKAFEAAERARARSLFERMNVGGGAKPMDLAAIRSKIAPRQKMLFYSVLADRVVIWIVSADAVKTSEVKIGAVELRQLIDHFLKEIAADRESSERAKAAGAKLFDLLFEPSRQAIGDARELIVVADKDLNRVPFAALYSSRDGRFLAEDFSIINAPGASVFAVATETAARLGKAASVLTIGDPRFLRDKHPEHAELPAAAQEADQISAMYERNRNLNGVDATLGKIREALDTTDIFHFAGHFVVNETLSSNSFLPLAGGDLPMAEIEKRRLKNTKLVVLSACETSGEKIFNGEGAIGAARSFLGAGAPVVVASGWKVESEATKDLMIAFHRELRNGKSSAEALRAAQISMLQSRAPFYWAAFAVYGGGER